MRFLTAFIFLLFFLACGGPTEPTTRRYVLVTVNGRPMVPRGTTGFHSGLATLEETKFAATFDYCQADEGACRFEFTDRISGTYTEDGGGALIFNLTEVCYGINNDACTNTDDMFPGTLRGDMLVMNWGIIEYSFSEF